MIAQAVALLPVLAALGTDASPLLGKRDNFAVAIDRDFADPSIMLNTDGKYYAYASTDLNGHEVQVATSDDGFSWTYQEGVSALSYNDDWVADTPLTWAPDVWPGNDGTYWMYYAAAKNDGSGLHCLGFAVGSDPMSFAPLVALEGQPWACDEAVGLIDPAMFQDQDGRRWVLYKVDGNSQGRDSTPIMIQQVEQDGWTKIGDPIEILDRDSKDGPLIEAPSLVLKDGIYYLTFSSNWYNTEYYDVAYATATSITGPYTKAHSPEAPLLVTDDSTGLWGPGGADVVLSGDSGTMVYHGWNHPYSEDDAQPNYRQMYAARVGFSDGKMTLI